MYTTSKIEHQVHYTMSETSNREWYYCDVLGSAQKGPVPGIVLCRLLEKGVGVSANSLVWKAGMESWQPMANVSE